MRHLQYPEDFIYLFERECMSERAEAEGTAEGDGEAGSH